MRLAISLIRYLYLLNFLNGQIFLGFFLAYVKLNFRHIEKNYVRVVTLEEMRAIIKDLKNKSVGRVLPSSYWNNVNLPMKN